MFLIFGAGNVPLLEKPGSWLLLAKCMKTIKMQANYDALNVVWEPVDTRPSERHSWLQMFSTHFPSDIGYLLSLKKILIPRQTPQTKYMFKVNKKNTRARHELFSKLTRKQNNVTEVVRMSSLLALNTFHPLR